MEFLLDPNIAYVLLVVGFVLTLLAILTPGTGLLEVGAFFCLAVVAYIAYNIGFNPWALIGLVVGIIPFVYATRKPRRGLWLALSLVIILVSSLYLFNTTDWLPDVNPLLAVAISAIGGGFIWITTSKTVKAHHAPPAHNLESLIGQVGEAKTEIHDSGSVQAGGELWTARSEQVIPAGSPVRVIGREGFILVVEKSE